MSSTKKKYKVVSVKAGTVQLKSAENEITISQKAENKHHGFLDQFRIRDSALIELVDSEASDAYKLVSSDQDKYSKIIFELEELNDKGEVESEIKFSVAEDTDFAAFLNTFHSVDVKITVNPSEAQETAGSNPGLGILGALAGAMAGKDLIPGVDTSISSSSSQDISNSFNETQESDSPDNLVKPEDC